jgi:hypothetical protein
MEKGRTQEAAHNRKAKSYVSAGVLEMAEAEHHEAAVKVQALHRGKKTRKTGARRDFDILVRTARHNRAVDGGCTGMGDARACHNVAVLGDAWPWHIFVVLAGQRAENRCARPCQPGGACDLTAISIHARRAMRIPR